MKIYEMIIDDGEQVFKAIRPAQNIKSLKAQYGGNGEFVRIKDVTEEWITGGHLCTESGIDFLIKTLQKAQYGIQEIEIISSLIRTIG